MNVEAGPWGGKGGTKWDDGTHDGIREINLKYEGCIDSIEVVYSRNGKPFLGGKHGGRGGSQTVKIKLNYPEEFLTSVSGHSCSVDFHGGRVTVVRSLSFKSNVRSFGPFGVNAGTPFSLVVKGEGQIVGMYGKSGGLLDSIGFRVKYTKPNEVKKEIREAKKECI